MAETVWLSLFATFKLPHWLMIVGALLVAIGCIGALVKEENRGSDSSPDQPIDTPRPQVPPPPNRLSLGEEKQVRRPPA